MDFLKTFPLNSYRYIAYIKITQVQNFFLYLFPDITEIINVCSVKLLQSRRVEFLKI
jgi:hypothetical protein